MTCILLLTRLNIV